MITVKGSPRLSALIWKYRPSWRSPGLARRGPTILGFPPSSASRRYLRDFKARFPAVTLICVVSGKTPSAREDFFRPADVRPGKPRLIISFFVAQTVSFAFK